MTDVTPDWAALEAELAAWREAGHVPRFWWRDDDAVTVTPALEQMLALSDRYAVPVHLSVIPRDLRPDLGPRLAKARCAFVLQHGFAHINHEPKGSPASEVGNLHPQHLQHADLRSGWQLLRAARLPNLLPGLVPPWNRIGAQTRAALPSLGYRFLSLYDGRADERPVQGLIQLNGHIDPIRWKYGAVFRGEGKMLAMIIAALQERRMGARAPHDPIGLITHHLQTGPAIWQFLDNLFARTTANTPPLWQALTDLCDLKTETYDD